MTSAILAITGRLTADPVLRTTNGGAGFQVANFSVAHTPRKQDETGEWVDAGDPLFVRVTVWRQLAENVAATLRRGDLVTVEGRPGVSLYTPEVGTPRAEMTLDAQKVALDLGRATATVARRSAADLTGDPEPWATPSALVAV